MKTLVYSLFALLALNPNLSLAQGDELNATPIERSPVENAGPESLGMPDSVGVERTAYLMRIFWDRVEGATQYRLTIRDYHTRKVLFARSGLESNEYIDRVLYGRLIIQVAAKRTGELGPAKSVFYKMLAPQPPSELNVEVDRQRICAQWNFAGQNAELGVGLSVEFIHEESGELIQRRVFSTRQRSTCFDYVPAGTYRIRVSPYDAYQRVLYGRSRVVTVH